jgi:hypothetical protein
MYKNNTREEMQIEKTSFIANTNTDAEMLDLLIKVSGHKSREQFASYMGVEASNLDDNPSWAYKYLEDTIDADLRHLGYVMKDTKQEGMLGEYKDAKEILREASVDNLMQQPFEIKEKDIITEAGTIKISLLTNITDTITELS